MVEFLFEIDDSLLGLLQCGFFLESVGSLCATDLFAAILCLLVFWIDVLGLIVLGLSSMK